MAAEQFVQPELDGLEQVVEVVGHAAGQLADGLHLLRLHELQLELLLLGDVDQIGDQPSLRAGQIELGGSRRLAHQLDLDRTRLAGQTLGRLPAGLGIDQVGQGVAEQLLAARHLLERRVGLGHLGDEGVGAVQQGRAKGRGGGQHVQGGRQGGWIQRRGGVGRLARRRRRIGQAHQQKPLAQGRDPSQTLGAGDL